MIQNNKKVDGIPYSKRVLGIDRNLLFNNFINHYLNVTITPFCMTARKPIQLTGKMPSPSFL